MSAYTDHIFPPPLIVEEEFASRAATDNAAARGELLEESDEIDCGQHKAVLDFRAATLSVLRVGANDVADACGQHFIETARLATETFSIFALPAASDDGVEEATFLCDSTTPLISALQHRRCNGELLRERLFNNGWFVEAISAVSLSFFSRRFVALRVGGKRRADGVLVVDIHDVDRDVFSVRYADDPARVDQRFGFVSDPRFFVTLDGTLMLSACHQPLGSGATEFLLFAYDRDAETFRHALTVDHAALGVPESCMRSRSSRIWVDGRLVMSARSTGCSVLVARIDRADAGVDGGDGGAPRWAVGAVTLVNTPANVELHDLSLSRCQRLVVASVELDLDWFEQLYSVDDIVSAADGTTITPVGERAWGTLPPDLDSGMPTREMTKVPIGHDQQERCVCSTTSPLAYSIRPVGVELHSKYESLFFRRVAGTLVATHQLSRADLDEDGVRSMRIANHDRVVIELNSGAERVFALPDASLCDGDTADDRRDRAARQAARDERHQRRVREVAARTDE